MDEVGGWNEAICWILVVLEAKANDGIQVHFRTSGHVDAFGILSFHTFPEEIRELSTKAWLDVRPLVDPTAERMNLVVLPLKTCMSFHRIGLLQGHRWFGPFPLWWWCLPLLLMLRFVV